MGKGKWERENWEGEKGNRKVKIWKWKWEEENGELEIRRKRWKKWEVGIVLHSSQWRYQIITIGW